MFYFKFITYDLSSMIFVLEDGENQAFQAETIYLTLIKSS